MKKRIFTRMSETPTRYRCTRKKCSWEGTDKEKAFVQITESMQEHVCPKCQNNEFYGLL